MYEELDSGGELEIEKGREERGREVERYILCSYVVGTIYYILCVLILFLFNCHYIYMYICMIFCYLEKIFLINTVFRIVFKTKTLLRTLHLTYCQELFPNSRSGHSNSRTMFSYIGLILLKVRGKEKIDKK